MSGLPGRLRTFLRKRKPILQSVLRNSFSPLVSVALIFDKARLAFSEEERKFFSKLGDLLTGLLESHYFWRRICLDNRLEDCFPENRRYGITDDAILLSQIASRGYYRRKFLDRRALAP